MILLKALLTTLMWIILIKTLIWKMITLMRQLIVIHYKPKK